MIKIKNLSLCYQQYKSPVDALLELISHKKRHTNFYALKEINLTLNKGESLGIIGNNGAGKSSLLRLLAGNLHPTSGTIQLSGAHSAILELGSGFQVEFTGWENARMGLILLGIRTKELDRYLQQVLDFSELGDFIHQPVKTYSSGMTMRLAFSIAIVIQPDILIVDEALSVGDQHFQKKSFDKMQEILSSNATLVFCSHNLYQVKEMCNKAIWLEHGKVRMQGDADSVVDAYQDDLRGLSQNISSTRNPLSSQPTIINIELEGGECKQESDTFKTDQYFAINTEVDPQNKSIDDIHLGLVIRRNDDIQCYGISTLHDDVSLKKLDTGKLGIRFIIDELPLLSGKYCIEAWLIDSSGVHIYDSRERCCYFSVRQESQKKGIGIAKLKHRWGEVALVDL